MEFIPLHIKDAYFIHIKLHKDKRGHLAELFNMNTYPEDIRRHFPVQQVTWSANHKNSVRGMHISPYAKLLTCVRGSVYDVVVDMRPDSPSYLQWAAINLTSTNGFQILIPPHCGHGYLALEEDAAVIYCQGGFFEPSVPQLSASVFDPILSITWPIENPEENVIISDKDKIVEHLGLPAVQCIPHRKRILIIGSTGQVGSRFFNIYKNHPEFIAIGTRHSLDTPLRFPFDMETDALDPLKVKLLLDACDPHVIIIAAAFTNVNLSQSQPEQANKVNCEAVLHIAKLGSERKIKVVAFSTDYVFNSPIPENFQEGININDKDIGLTEEAPKNPPNLYGESKLNAEKALLREVPTSLIIRTSRVYGPEEIRKNFVNQVVRNLSTGQEMKLLSDEVSCPTYNIDLCEAVMLLIKKECSGIYHIVGPEAMSKYKWGLKITDYFKLDSKLLLSKSAEELKLSTPRGKFSALSTHKFRTEFPNFKFRTMTESLRQWEDSKEYFPIVNC